MENISEETLGKYHKNPTSRIQKIENINLPIKYINSFVASIGIKNTYSAENIIDQDKQFILGMVWTLTPTPPLSLTLTSTFYPRQLLPRLTPTLPLPLTAQPTPAGSAPEVEADPVGAADRRTALAALWQEALYALPGAATTPPAQMAPLLRRASALSRRPASVALRCRSVRVGFAPRRVLNAAYGALAADLASRGVVYGSASSLLDAVRGEACNPMCSAPPPRACRL